MYSHEDTEPLLVVLRDYGVPLKHALPFVFRINDIAISEISEKATIQRTGLYQVLNDTFAASDNLRETVKELIGVDPWMVYETPSQIKHLAQKDSTAVRKEA